LKGKKLQELMQVL